MKSLKILIFTIPFFVLSVSVQSQKGSNVEARPDGGFTKTISGTWDCGEFGSLSLTQNGNRVTGTYDYNGGSVFGNIIGNKFVGTWSESETKDGGSFEFELQILRMSPNPTNLKGKYNHSNDRKWVSGWDCFK